MKPRAAMPRRAVAAAGSVAGRLRGFTLIEALVAMVVATTAAALIFAQLRSLLDRAEREQSHGLAVTRLLNDAARFAAGGIESTPQATPEAIRLIPVDPEMPTVEVFNTSVRDSSEVLPPLTLAYSPVQRYALRRDGYQLSFLAPALKLPDGVEAVRPAAAPTKLTPAPTDQAPPADTPEQR